MWVGCEAAAYPCSPHITFLILGIIHNTSLSGQPGYLYLLTGADGIWHPQGGRYCRL